MYTFETSSSSLSGDHGMLQAIRGPGGVSRTSGSGQAGFLCTIQQGGRKITTRGLSKKECKQSAARQFLEQQEEEEEACNLDSKTNDAKVNNAKVNDIKVNDVKVNETKVNYAKVNKAKVNGVKGNDANVNEVKVGFRVYNYTPRFVLYDIVFG